jgi:anthranilate/para-aminobenzoate synthase component I
MKLSELATRESFALLGPGFGGGQPVLVRELVPEAHAPHLLFASFEAASADALGFAGEARPVEIELDITPQPPELTLRTPGCADAITRIREAIAAGDVYQVCYTVRVELPPVSGAELFALMCQRGVPRFAAWARLPSGHELVSASPELFFEIDGRRIVSEPMKGTARPGAAGVLSTSAKDECELAMITDLVRNDLTRVCRPRSVRVASPRRLVELPYALQTVSDVVGELAPGVGVRDVLAALHPGGSVTGAPKQAALAMIRALEPEPRGAYCGALGYVQDERTTVSLLIRTASRHKRGWTYGAGGGIVYDSEADRELEEIVIKLGALGCVTRCSS